MTNQTSKQVKKMPSELKKITLSLKKMQFTIDNYFAECDTHTKEIYVKSSGTIENISSPLPYTLEGLSLATGINREVLLNYELYETNRKKIDIINQAKLRIQENIIKRALEGDSNAAITAFILKNNFGYKDKGEQEAASENEEVILHPIHVKVIRNIDDLNDE